MEQQTAGDGRTNLASSTCGSPAPLPTAVAACPLFPLSLCLRRAVPIGKLMLYVGAGGIDPKRVLPVCLDAGTDNVALREQSYYLGLPQPRLKGDDYFSLVFEFVNAVHYRWPNAGASCARSPLTRSRFVRRGRQGRGKLRESVKSEPSRRSCCCLTAL